MNLEIFNLVYEKILSINVKTRVDKMKVDFPCGKKIPLARPVITKDMIERAIDALNNDKLVNGEYVMMLEEDFAKFIGRKYAVATNSGTSALILAYMTLDQKSNFFATSDATFIATASAGVIAGGKPILVDIDLNTYNISTSELGKILKKHRVKTVVPVHLYGYPADMYRIIELQDIFDFYIIEDAAQAHGAKYNGKKVGTFGDVSIFSFYPTKNMTVGGDGGILVTDDEEIASLARKLRDNGRKSRYVHDKIGFVFRLNSVNAAVGLVQLNYLETWNENRRYAASLYDKNLSELNDQIKTPPRPDKNILPVYHLYVIKLKNKKIRDSLGGWLGQNGIQTLIHYPVPLHMQPALSNISLYYKTSNSEEWANTVLSLPMYSDITKDEVDCISDLIKEFFNLKLYERRDILERGLEWYKKLM